MTSSARRPPGRPRGGRTVRDDKSSRVPHNAPDAAEAAPAGRRPIALVVVCALVLLQAVVLVGLAVAWLVGLVRGGSELPGATVFLAAFATGVAVVLALAARGLWSGRRWARSPVMTWEVLLVVLSAGWLGVETSLWAVGVLVSAVVVAVGLLLRSVVAVTAERPEA